MRVTVEGHILTEPGKSLGDQLAEIADRQPARVQSVGLQGKVPQVRAGILSACVGMPEHGKPDT